MKINEILDTQGPQAKMKKLKRILPKEVMLANYDGILNIIASKLTINEIDLLAAELSNSLLTDDEVDFFLKMMEKKFKSLNLTTTFLQIGPDPKTLRVRLDSKLDELAPPPILMLSYKGKWKLGYFDGPKWKTTKFDKAPDALAASIKFIEKVYAKYNIKLGT